MPFGPLSSLTYGNGLALTKTFTQDYLISTLVVQNASTSNVVVSRAYTFGDGINITGIADNVNPARSEAYAYTASNRLQQGGGVWGTLNWSYDGVGNRASEALSPGYSDTYNYAGGNNQLASLTQGGTTIRAFSYDGAGNLIADSNGSTTYNYGYNNSGRLATLTIGSTQTSSYSYDGLERLAIDASPYTPLSGITQFVYDQAGHLLAESDDSGNTLTEYVWLDDMPIALVANVSTSPTLYFVHADHLNRPLRMTDGGENVVWDAVYNPFGGVNSITGSATNNLRFPGQYFLIEDGLHYNWYRHYDPTVGRYIQPDPLQFINGASLYAYVRNAPIGSEDPRGLWQITLGGGFGYGGAITYGYNGGQWNFGFYFGVGVGATVDYDPSDSGGHTCGLDAGVTGSADVGPLGLSSTVNAQGDNSASIDVPSPDDPSRSYNILDPSGAGNPTYHFGAGGYLGAGGKWYW